MAARAAAAGGRQRSRGGLYASSNDTVSLTGATLDANTATGGSGGSGGRGGGGGFDGTSGAGGAGGIGGFGGNGQGGGLFATA